MAMLSAASSCRFFAVKEKLVSSFMALLAVVLIAAADIEEIPLRFYELTTEFFGAVFGFCCSEMLVVIREYSDFMVENSETTWWNEGTP